MVGYMYSIKYINLVEIESVGFEPWEDEIGDFYLSCKVGLN